MNTYIHTYIYKVSQVFNYDCLIPENCILFNLLQRNKKLSEELVTVILLLLFVCMQNLTKKCHCQIYMGVCSSSPSIFPMLVDLTLVKAIACLEIC